MKYLIRSLAATACIATLCFSCKKTPTASSTVVTSSTAINDLFTALKSTPQNYTVTAGTYSMILGRDSTLLRFYPNSFKDKNGVIITSGTINIQLTEMLTPGDMIANRTATMAGNALLSSGGEVIISATKGGQQVYANKYGLWFRQPASSAKPMQLYYSNTGSNALVTWFAGDTTRQGGILSATDSVEVGWDSTWKGNFSGMYSSAYYAFDSCLNFGFANCDWFWDTTKTGVSVVLPDHTFDTSNTVLFLVLPSKKGVICSDNVLGGLRYTASTNTLQLISEGNTQIVPLGLDYKLIAITNKSGTYYYSETSGNVTANMIVHATMSVQTLPAIQALLKAL